MRGSRILPTVALLLLSMNHPVAAQQAALPVDSARAEIRAVLRAFYSSLESRNWDALAAYVLSPKLLERRVAPGDLQAVARDRTRSRRWSHPLLRAGWIWSRCSASTCRSPRRPRPRPARRTWRRW